MLSRFLTLVIAAVGAAVALPLALERPSRGSVTAEIPARLGDFVTSFDSRRLLPERLDPNIVYDLDPQRERFFVHVPRSYQSAGTHGLVVYIDPGDVVGAEPKGWEDVLDRRQLLFIAPQNAGNRQPVNRRLGLAVLAALEMSAHYKIDPHRVYAAGLSGGARIAGQLGFFQPELFHGTVQSCGADFYLHVPKVVATSEVDTAGYPYGFFEAPPYVIERAKRTRFALITGSRDFRHGNIIDIYRGGFAKMDFKAKLFDIAGMEHANADAPTLEAALDFIDVED